MTHPHDGWVHSYFHNGFLIAQLSIGYLNSLHKTSPGPRGCNGVTGETSFSRYVLSIWQPVTRHLPSLPQEKPLSADPCRQQGERVRGGITSSKGQEVITSSKGKKQENKKEETRSKKQLQATSGKKQETRSQEATSGWKTGQRASFLVDSKSNVRQAAGTQLRELVFL